MNLTLNIGLGSYIPLALYGLIILAALLSIFWRPRISLYLLVLLIPLQTTRSKLDVFPLGAEAVDILWLSVFLGLLLRREPIIRSPRMKGLLIALAVVTYFSLWRGWLYLGGEPPIRISDQRFSDWKNYMVMPIIGFMIAWAMRDKKQLKLVMLFMVLATCVVNWSFFRSTAGRDLSHFSYNVRDAGVLGYAGVNGFAAFIAQLIVLLSTMLFFIREKVVRLALIPLVGFSAYCLLFSFSRGGYLACLLGITFMAFFRMRMLLLGVLVLILGWQAILPAAVQERINMTYDSSDNQLDPSAGDRVVLWQDATKLIIQNPIGGAGFDTYQFMRRVGPYGDTHNYYLKVLVETGLIGFCLLLAILFNMWRLGFRLFRSTDDLFLQGLGLGFASLILCAAAANLFGDRWTYLQVDGYIWVLLGCVMSAKQIVETQELEKAADGPVLTQVEPRPVNHAGVAYVSQS
jgi:putative inorganic carbon (HCO3(-)) transporter